MSTTKLIFYLKTKEYLYLEGVAENVIPGTGSISIVILYKKEQILWSQPRSTATESLEWQPGTCDLTTFPCNSYA